MWFVYITDVTLYRWANYRLWCIIGLRESLSPDPNLNRFRYFSKLLKSFDNTFLENKSGEIYRGLFLYYYFSIFYICVYFLTCSGIPSLYLWKWPTYIYCSDCTLNMSLYTIQCTVYTIHIVQFPRYKVQCTMYTVQCTVYNIQCTIYNVQCTITYCSMFEAQQKSGTISFKLPKCSFAQTQFLKVLMCKNIITLLRFKSLLLPNLMSWEYK